jgi:hypothetical protein
MKKLRYATEYMGGLYLDRSVKLYVKPIKKLQKLLGEINDSAMAISMAEQLCKGEALDLVPGLGDIAAWAERRREAALAKLPKAWAAFNDEKRFWYEALRSEPRHSPCRLAPAPAGGGRSPLEHLPQDYVECACYHHCCRQRHHPR